MVTLVITSKETLPADKFSKCGKADISDEPIKCILHTPKINRGRAGEQFLEKSGGPNISLIKTPVRKSYMFLNI